MSLSAMSVRKTGPSLYEFSRDLVEIAIIDQRGKRLWHRRKVHAQESISWNGVDIAGAPVSVGSYIFKLLNAAGETSYLPFIHA